MNKYIDAEKLIAEIERLYEIAREASYNGEIEGEMTAYDKILSFIASLQQEQPPTEREIAEAHRYAEMIRERDRARIQQEQPEVELEKEIEQYTIGFIGELKCYKDWTPRIARFARYFYGLRNRALEEAAQHVYEFWTGGTMDDFLRGMAELGKVLNARKEE